MIGYQQYRFVFINPDIIKQHLMKLPRYYPLYIVMDNAVYKNILFIVNHFLGSGELVSGEL